MKKLVLLLFFFSSSFVELSSQNLRLQNLQTICEFKDWNRTNQYLVNKGWEYYESEKGSKVNYNTITWAFDKNYNDAASGWFYLYTFEGFPNKIRFEFFNGSVYKSFLRDLTNYGYKPLKNDIEDNQIINKYGNNKYILEITVSKREKENYSNESLTSYQIELIKKESVYDPYNGIKKEYYPNSDKLKYEYTLKNNQIEGWVKEFYENGTIKSKQLFKNDKKNGAFASYNEYGKQIESKNYKNGLLNGSFSLNFYNEDVISEKLTGQYSKGKKNGTWLSYSIDEQGKSSLISTRNFLNGDRHGFFEEYKGDTLEIKNYKNGLLHGEFEKRTYTTLSNSSNGIPGFWDTKEKGIYKNGKRTGIWKEFGMSKKLAEGLYFNNKKKGSWKTFVPLGNHEGEVASIEEYLNGQLEGISKTYYQYEFNDDGIFVCKKVNFTHSYSNGNFEGNYQKRDSLDRIIEEGRYSDNLPIGKAFLYDYVDDSTQTVIKQEFNFSNAKLHGIYRKTSSNEKTLIEGRFFKGKKAGVWKEYNKNGILIKENHFDSFGKILNVNYFSNNVSNKIILKTDITGIEEDKYKVKITNYSADTIEYYNSAIKKDFISNFLITMLAKKHGKSKLIANGQLLEEGVYNNNQKEGVWKYYYKNQNALLARNETTLDETFYYLDKKEKLFKGTFKGDNNSGWTEYKIKNGKKNGKAKVFNKENQLINKVNYKAGKLK